MQHMNNLIASNYIDKIHNIFKVEKNIHITQSD